MKPNIHPENHMIKVIMTDGTEYTTRTTWGEEGKEMKLVIDPKTHPAYTGKRKMVDSEGLVDKFNKRYGRKA